MRPLAIVNPASGGGRCGQAAPRLLSRVAPAIDIETSARPGHASEIVADAYAAGRRTFVVLGGDGALFEVVNGLPPAAIADGQTLVCVVPLGTGNSLVRDLPVLPLDEALAPKARTAARDCDLLRILCRERTFHCANMVSYGFAAAVGRVVNNHLKPFGAASYSIGVLWMVARLAPHLLPYALDGGRERREQLTLLSVANSRYTGAGMLMALEAEIDDGLMDVVSGEAIGRMKLLRLFPKIFDGSHVDDPAVRVEKAKSLAFDFDAPVGMIADGEFVVATPQRIDVAPRALRMLAIATAA